MTDQPTLFGAPPATLPVRQQQALDYARRHREGITADEAGAHLHQLRGKHDAGVRCAWCSTDGKQVLRALRKKGLVVRKRSGHWKPTQRPDARDHPVQTDQIPF